MPEGEPSLGKVPRVMVRDEHWFTLAKGLLERGLCQIYKEEDLFCINGDPVLNGLFATLSKLSR